MFIYNIMANLMSDYFGPFDKNACVYFLIMTVIFFISLVLVFVSELLFIVQNYKRLTFKMVSAGILILFNIFLAYFVNRLLYGMCISSLA
jgi:hypothetical protein